MAGIGFLGQPIPTVDYRRSSSRRLHAVRSSLENHHEDSKRATPQVLKLAVSGVTELLRFFSSSEKTRFFCVYLLIIFFSISLTFLFLLLIFRVFSRNDGILVSDSDSDPVSCVDDVVAILKYDYANAYFVTGETAINSRNFL